ncbi:MAG TPA: hypothetical protein VGI33_03510 [Paenibacillus sp.]
MSKTKTNLENSRRQTATLPDYSSDRCCPQISRLILPPIACRNPMAKANAIASPEQFRPLRYHFNNRTSTHSRKIP